MEGEVAIFGQLVQLGAFLGIAHIGGGTMVVLHHLTDTAVNSITGATKKTTGIAGIHGTGTQVESKGFKKENMGTGKKLKLESVIEMANAEEEGTEFGFLKTTIKL